MNGEFLSKRLKTQTAPRFKKNCNPDCHTNPVGTVTCRAMGPATPPGLFFLQSASSRPSNAHVYWISASIGATRASSRYIAESSKYAACSVIPSPAGPCMGLGAFGMPDEHRTCSQPLERRKLWEKGVNPIRPGLAKFN